MACISAPTAMLVGGGLQAGGSLLSGIMGSSAASDAAKVQASTARDIAAMQQARWEQTQANLAPFMTAGQSAIEKLLQLTGTGPTENPLASPLLRPLSTRIPIQTNFAPTMARLEATPGYRFALQQGEKAAQGNLASQGLGRSGAAGIAADQFAQGLASTTFQNQFTNWYNQQQLGMNKFLAERNLTLAQRQQIFNMIAGIGTQGESAAAGMGTLGIQSAAQVGNTLASGAASQAAGIVGSTNALTGGISGVGSAASNTALLLALNNAGMFGANPAAGTAGQDFSGGGTQG